MTENDRQVAMVIQFLEEEAAGFGDSISPGFAVRYRAAASALTFEKNPTPALEILAVEEATAKRQVAEYQRRLVRLQSYRVTLESLATDEAAKVNAIAGRVEMLLREVAAADRTEAADLVRRFDTDEQIAAASILSHATRDGVYDLVKARMKEFAGKGTGSANLFNISRLLDLGPPSDAK